MTDTMTDLKATVVVKNKFWIVEKDGEKVATIQALEDGVVWVEGPQREKYPTIKMLKDKHNVEIVKSTKTKASKEHEVNGYPASCKPYNALYNVTQRLPIYSKEAKSKSFYCAGYYLVKINNNWTRAYCPKLITLQRYEFKGPFHTKEEQESKLRESWTISQP